MCLNRPQAEQPAFEVAVSAVVIVQVHVGAGSLLAQGVVVRSREGGARLGTHAAVLENGVLVGWREHPVEIGQRPSSGIAPRSSVLTSATCARSGTGHPDARFSPG